MIHRLTGATEEVNNRLRQAQTRSTLRLRATPSEDNHRYLWNNFKQRQEVYTPNKAMKVQYMFIPTVYIYLRNSIAVSKLKGSLYNVTYEPRLFCHLQEKETARPSVFKLCTLNISTAQIWGPSTWKSRVAGFHLKVLWCLVFNAWLKYCAVWTCVTLYGWKSLYFELTIKTAALF